jgi:hypothetical protein
MSIRRRSRSPRAQDVAQATSSDTTLANFASDVSTPALENEAARVLAAIDELNSLYAGGSADLGASLLANPTFLADEPSYQAEIASVVSAASDSSATAADVGGSVLDLGSGVGLVEKLSLADPAVALGAAIVGVGGLIINELDNSSAFGNTGSAPYSMWYPIDTPKWIATPFDGHRIGAASPGHWQNGTWVLDATYNDQNMALSNLAGTSAPTVPNLDSGHHKIGYLLAWHAPSPAPSSSYSSPSKYTADFYGYTTGQGDWEPAPNDGLSSFGDCTQDYATVGMPPGPSWLAANGATLLIGPAQAGWFGSCTSGSGSHQVGYSLYAVAIARGPSQMKLGFPHTGNTTGLPTLTQTPITTLSQLWQAIQNLATILNDGNHTAATNLFDGATGTTTNGNPVVVPGLKIIPAPTTNEPGANMRRIWRAPGSPMSSVRH